MNGDDAVASPDSAALAEAAAAEIARRERAHATATAEGYYGRPALKPPVWTWEVPLYFFVGGIAGTSGGAPQPVTRDPTFDGFPMFSPDGRWLAFASNRNTHPRAGERRGETNLFLARWRR